MKADTVKSHRERVLRVLVEIESNLSEDLTLETLSRQGDFSPYHFHRVFRALVGESLKEYVRQLRLERAAHELTFSARSIIDLALDAGYETHESFTRAFRAAFGRSPSAYRKTHAQLQSKSASSQTVKPSEYRPSPSELRSANASPCPGRIERLPRLRVAFIRHVGPYENVPMVFERLQCWARKQQAKPIDLMLLGIAHDNPYLTSADKLRFDCCALIDATIKAEGESRKIALELTLNLARLVVQAGLSKFHFQRLFKGAIGMTPSRYHIRRNNHFQSAWRARRSARLRSANPSQKSHPIPKCLAWVSGNLLDDVTSHFPSY